MALIKKSDFVHLNEAQLNEKLTQLKRELLKLNAQRAIKTTLESSGKIKAIKRTIAKIYTTLRQGVKIKEVKKLKT
jgi:ribosomal protein L29